MRTLAKRAAGAAVAAIALAVPATAWAGAEGPGTPQATAANATFLATTPAPPGGAAAVCVIDSGVDTDTDLGPALAGRVASLGGVPGDPSDQGATLDTGRALPKHGTYVAGVIASQIDGVGTNGIWPAAKVYSTRVFSGGATAQVTDYVRAMDWCSNHPAVKVINLSLSGIASATVLQRQVLADKIAEVRGPLHNINVVAAAGNNGATTTVGYPANADGVLAVGATDVDGTLTTLSNRGTGLDIATLGFGTCLTTGYGSKLAVGDGTSYAAPVVSAVLAAMRSYDPALTPDQAETLLLTNVDLIDGVKVLNAAKAFMARGSLVALAVDVPTASRRGEVTNRCEPPRPVGTNAGGGSTERTTAAQKPPPPDSGASAIAIETLAVAAPVVDVQLPKTRPSSLRLDRPTLRSLTIRHGRLRVRIGGYQAGQRAVFRLSYRRGGAVRVRRFVRGSGSLTVRATNWTELRIRLRNPDASVSRPLTVRPSQEF